MCSRSSGWPFGANYLKHSIGMSSGGQRDGVTGRTGRSGWFGDGRDAAEGMTLLASDRAGHGEPLLLLHGIGSTRDDFSALAPPAGRGLRRPLRRSARSRGIAARHVAPDRRGTDRRRGGRPRRPRTAARAHPRQLPRRPDRHRARRPPPRAAPSSRSPRPAWAFPAERLHQGVLMATSRNLMRTFRPTLAPLATSPARPHRPAGRHARAPLGGQRDRGAGHAGWVRRCDRFLVDALVGGPPGRADRPAPGGLPRDAHAGLGRRGRRGTDAALPGAHPGISIPVAARSRPRPSVGLRRAILALVRQTAERAHLAASLAH